MKILCFAVLIVVAYLVSWSVAYVWLVGTDFGYYAEYLRLAWTNPGEIPSFLQFIAIVATTLILLVVIGVRKYRHRLVK